MTPVVWRIRASTTATGPNPTAEKNIGAKTMSGTTVVDLIAAHKEFLPARLAAENLSSIPTAGFWKASGSFPAFSSLY